MALSLDSIFQPFNTFFQAKFAGGAGSGTADFRFSHAPVSFVDSDFLSPVQPEAGPSATVAQEIFSGIVDKIVKRDPDGRNVWFAAALASDLYRDEIVGPSLPLSSAGVSAEDGQALIDAFNQMKSDAIGRLQKNRAASILAGPGAQYLLSTALPARWWDKGANDIWISQSFKIDDAQAKTPAPGTGLVFKLRSDDDRVMSVLQPLMQPVAAPVAAPIRAAIAPAAAPTPRLNMATLSALRPMILTTIPQRPPPAAPQLAGRFAFRPGARLPIPPPAPPPQVQPQQPPPPRFQLMQQVSHLPVQQRIEVQSALSHSAPTAPVTSTSVTIGFDYCLVTINRAWLHQGFINNTHWYIPGQDKGTLSADDGHGLPAIPVAFVAIKNLRIQANWSAEDISALENSVQFGPFNFDSTVVNNTISHDGIQIVGWLLSPSPPLPPNPPPVAAAVSAGTSASTATTDTTAPQAAGSPSASDPGATNQPANTSDTPNSTSSASPPVSAAPEGG
ncbi:MAG: hypothetical protein JO261_15440 [Alphaproteobacteria bacterium]|nr:hypothetical protein [Alphaproteobacteria bacterium]MBV9695090.1 hypothetical protein [Alphaproteobacteria bacterium]